MKCKVNCTKFIPFNCCCRDERVGKFFFGLIGSRYCKEAWDGEVCTFKDPLPSPKIRKWVVEDGGYVPVDNKIKGMSASMIIIDDPINPAREFPSQETHEWLDNWAKTQEATKKSNTMVFGTINNKEENDTTN